MAATLPSTERLQADLGIYFRTRDLAKANLTFRDLEALVAKGRVEKYSRGVYRLADAEGDEYEGLALVSTAIPNGIVCLTTALAFHGIGTQLPSGIWYALDRKAHKPTRTDVATRLRIVRFSGVMQTYGVETHTLMETKVRITSPARTVVDCFRYRNTCTKAVAYEALTDAVFSKIATVDDICRAADVCRISSVVNPCLEAILAAMDPGV